MMDSGFLVYTDGSCAATDRVGGFAWVVIDSDESTASGQGSDVDTTISRMELMGPIDSLAWILDEFGPSVVLVQSDSLYVVDGITDRTRMRRKNNDLWDMLDAFVDMHELVEFQHVKGHAGHKYNEMVDGMAGKMRKTRKENGI